MTTRGGPQWELATVGWAAAFNALGEATCLLDGEGTVQRCNEAMSRLLDLPPGQILGRKCHELMPVSSPRPASCPFAKSRETRRQETAELPAGERWFSVIVDPIFDAAGEFCGAVHRLNDITDRKRLDGAVQKTLDRLHDTLHAIPDLLFEVDQDGRILEFHASQEDLLYVPPREFLGKTVGEVLPPEASRVVLQALAEAAQQGSHRGATYALDMPSGRHWYELCISARRKSPLAQQRFLAVARDVTSRRQAEESLRRVSVYTRSLIEASLDPLVVIGPDGKITDVNAATEAATGWSRQDLIGTDFSDYFSQPERARAGYQRAFQEGSVHDYPLEIRHREGHLTAVLYNAAVYRDEDGKVIGVFAAARDVTRLKQAEESLRLSEQRLRLHVQQTALGVIEWNTDFRAVGWNPAAERIFGYPATEALGRHGSFIIPASARAHTDAVWDCLLSNQRGGERTTNENVTKTGQTILCEWHNTPLTTSTGEVVGVASIVQDITARKRAERDRELQERRLESLLKISQRQDRTVDELLDFALTEVLAICESELGFIQYYDEDSQVFTLHAWSKAAMQVCRIPNPPRLFELATAGLWAETVRQRRAIVVNDYPAPHPRKKGYPEGHAPLSRFLAVPVFSEGRIVAVTAVANKASEYTLDDERQLTLMMDEVWKVAERMRAEAALAEAKAAAEAANRAKSEFLANVSHELRTPLHAVLGMTELALRDKLPPPVRAYLQQASDSAEMLLELINELLDFSRMEAGRMTLEDVDFNLRTTLNYEIKSLAVKAHRKGLELCLDMPRRVPAHLIGDPLRLRQVLTNLIGNAIKFTELGEVVVRVAVESDAAERVVLRFSVTDTGIGISREDQQKIFARFTQLDASATRGHGGIGLGLTIASTLAELMGGRLDVDSEPGRGSTFLFSVPFRLPSDFAEPAPLEIAFLSQLRDRPVLVVDRHATSRQILCEMCGAWGTKPQAADCARTALAQAQEAQAAGRPFPLAIVDPDLADRDGWDLIRDLRKHQRRRAATIVLVSSASYQGQGQRHRPTASVLSLTKPVSQGELLRAMVRGLRLVAAPGPKPAAAADALHSPRPLRILLAEDAPASRMFATDVLTERGHAVQTVEDGRQAFELVRAQDFDVILMDVQMPTMDGFQTTAAIRALPDPAKSRVPIVAVTAHAIQGYEERCLAAGMNGYLSKPLRSQVLIEMVERLAASPHE